MRCAPYLWTWIADSAFDVVQLELWILKYFIAWVTLVSLGRSLTSFTLADHKSISQKHRASATVKLFDWFFFKQVILIALLEDILHNFLMIRMTGPSKMIIRNIEPLVNLFMKLMILITNLPRRFFHLFCFYLSGCAILVSATNKQHVLAF